MPARVVKDWLAEYKALPEAELNSYANTLRTNDDLVDELYSLFEDDISHEVLDPVCHQLFDFYRSGQLELQRFTKEAIPVLIGSYLSAHSRNDKKRCIGIETCLLGIYNLEVIDKDGKPKVQTFTIPTLAVPSVYHEPPSLAALALTETALLKYHSDEHVKITVGPMPQVERINSQNRLMTMTYIMNCYNADVGHLSPRSHYALCKMASRLSKTGFDSEKPEDTESLNDSMSSQSSRGFRRPGILFRSEPRIQVSSGFLVELLNGIYFAMFNGQAREGIQALEDIHHRASYELYADVLLVTNAIKNSLKFNPSGQPQDGPMGISISISPSQVNTAFSKSAITNASFRTKKLPDDIDVLSDDENRSPPPYTSLRPNLHSPLSLEEVMLVNTHMSNSDILDLYDRQLEQLQRSESAAKAKSGVKRSNSKDSGKKGSSVRRSDSRSKSPDTGAKRSDSRSKGQDAEFKRSDSGSSRGSRVMFRFGSLKRGSSRSKKKKDIDVPQDEAAKANPAEHPPPNYEEAVTSIEPEKSTSVKSSNAKMPKPLKSIMKKGSSASEKQEKGPKVSKRESESQKHNRRTVLGVTGEDKDSHSHSPKNPKHSISMMAGLGMAQNGTAANDTVDPSMVGVQVTRSSSTTTGRTFQTVDYIDLKQAQGPNHKQTPSASEDSGSTRGHSREVSSASNYDQEDLDYGGLRYEGVDGKDEPESQDTAL